LRSNASKDDGDPSRLAALAPQDDAVATRRMVPAFAGTTITSRCSGHARGSATIVPPSNPI